MPGTERIYATENSGKPNFPIEQGLATSKFPVPGTNFPVRGTGYGEFGANFPVHGTGYGEFGANFPVRGTGYGEFGVNFPVRGTGYGEFGVNFPVRGTGYGQFGVNFPVCGAGEGCVRKWRGSPLYSGEYLREREKSRECSPPSPRPSPPRGEGDWSRCVQSIRGP